MSQSLLIARRELYAYMRSPIGFLIIAGALLAGGMWFNWRGVGQPLLSAEVLAVFFETASGMVMISAVVLGTRLLAEERQSGSMILLKTAPINEREIVLGKFLAGYGMIVLLILLTAYMPLHVYLNGKVSFGHIAVGYAGLLLLGAASIAVCLFASALASSQVVAVILGAAMMLAMILLWAPAKVTEPPLNKFLSALALHHDNFRPFMQGILQLRSVAFYVLVTYFFLLCSSKVLEARRWR
jgi:ABC-2 type transport system permease protein